MNSPAPLRRREPLAQVELLVLFHPLMQSGGNRPVAIPPANATQGWMTVDVHGRIGRDEEGARTIEDMRLEVQGEDVESKLPQAVVDGLVQYVLND